MENRALEGGKRIGEKVKNLKKPGRALGVNLPKRAISGKRYGVSRNLDQKEHSGRKDLEENGQNN